VHFANFWQYVKAGEVVTWGWSDESESAASKCALERQAAVLQRIAADRGNVDTYGYPDRPMREEVLREFRSSKGELLASVSRNAAGCDILNALELLFVDIDTPDAPRPGLLARLLRLW